MGHADYFKMGDNNCICDRCGFKYKASELKQTWDGLYVCEKDWEPRHPQDFVRGVEDIQEPLLSRSESPDSFVSVGIFNPACTVTGVAGVAGYAMAGCAQAGRPNI